LWGLGHKSQHGQGAGLTMPLIMQMTVDEVIE
jgi:hypothetical protein